MANVRKILGKTLAIILVVAMLFGMMSTAIAARPGPGWGGGGYVLDERYFDGDRYFGWDTYTRGATLRNEEGKDVYNMITVSVGDETLDKGDTERSVTNQDVVDHGVTISNIPAGYYISAYKIVCEKYACYTDQAGNATDEQVSLDAGQGSYHVSVSKAEMGHANNGATAYYILIELSAFKIEDEETVTYPYNVIYNYGELTEELADEPATVDSNTYVYNATAEILSPNADAVAAAKALGYKFVGWEIESVEGILAITSVVGTKLAPAAAMIVTGETTLKALWEKIPVPAITVDKTADGETYEIGEIVTWTITVTNTSEYTAYDVVVTDAIPAGLKLVEGESVTVIDELAPGASETITLKTEVVEAGTHTNEATASWKNVDGEPFNGEPGTETIVGELPPTYTLTVNYVDTEGNPLTEPIVSPGLAENSEYTTEQKSFTGYTFVEITGDAAEGIMDGDKEVTYVYTLNEYTLVVNYVDTEGNELTKSIVESGLAHGSEYTTEEKSFTGYTFVEITGDAAEGIMDSDKEVTYVYDLNEYTLTVNYVDTEGNELTESIVESGLAHGSEYTTEQKSFTGYGFVETTGDAAEGVMDGDKEVTYVYTLNEYTLVVNYVDTEGNELTESIVESGLAHGSEYTTEEKSFTGYTFVEITGDAAEGIMDGDKEVTYVYTLNEYTLVVNYVDTEGNAVANQVVETGLTFGTKYTTEQLTIEGYTFVETTGDAVEGVMDSDKEVTYVYEKNPNLYTLTVNYVDTEGNKIADSVIKTGLEEGTEYTTEQLTIDGYEFVEVTGDAAEGIMDSDKEVTYVYAVVIPEEPVVVVDKTADGETYEVGEIVTWTITVTNISEFTAYNVVVVDDVPAGLEVIEGDTFVTIDELAPGASVTITIKTRVHEAGYHTNSALASWTNVEGEDFEGEPSDDTVFADIPATYTLIVNYVDTEGNVIAETIVVAGMEEGAEYTTEQLAIDGYEFVEITGDAASGIMDSDKEVTYVYEAEEVIPPYIPPYVPPYIPPTEPPVEPPVDPDEDIFDDEVPLTDIPDEEVPKTSDPIALMVLAAAASGVGLTGLVIRRKKDEE